MIEDRLLILKFNKGNREALGRIYEKYKNDLLILATALLNHDSSIAEDVVHDVFASFAQKAGSFKLTGRLKGYLSICVANCARNNNRANRLKHMLKIKAATLTNPVPWPIECFMQDEQSKRLTDAIDRLPFEQKETIMLYLHSGMKFKEIARVRNVSINTIQSRYKYGLRKLQTILKS